MKLYSLLLFLITALLSHAKKPNFVIIFNDDMGYADLGCFGADKIKTPRVDQMAKEGRKFTSFYVASAVCSASRSHCKRLFHVLIIRDCSSPDCFSTK